MEPQTILHRIQTGQTRLGRFVDVAGWVHWIAVPRQRSYEPFRADGRVWVRRGRATVEPSPSELQDLYNLFGYILTEERAIEAASERDIDVDQFRAFLIALRLELDEESQLPPATDLLNRCGLTQLSERLHATLYGILAFGKTPQAYPQTRSFWIECVVYSGTDRSAEVLAVGEGRGRLDEQVKAGGHPRSRNKLMANFLLVKGLMESRGRGWPLMRRLMREHSGTEPDLLEDRDVRFVRVTFRLRG